MKYAIWGSGYALVEGPELLNAQLKTQHGPKLAAVLGEERFKYLCYRLTALQCAFDRRLVGLDHWVDEPYGVVIVAIPDECDVKMYYTMLTIDGVVYRPDSIWNRVDSEDNDVLLDFSAGDLDDCIVDGARSVVTLRGSEESAGDDWVLRNGHNLEDIRTNNLTFESNDRLLFNAQHIPLLVAVNGDGNEQFLRLNIEGTPCGENTIITGCTESVNRIWLVHNLSGVTLYSYTIDWDNGCVDCTHLHDLVFKNPVSKINCIGMYCSTLWIGCGGVMDQYNTDTLEHTGRIDGVYQDDCCEDPPPTREVTRAKSARK